MIVLGLYEVSKKFRTYNYRNRWIRKEIIDFLRRKKRPNDRWSALRDISFDIKAGESVAILGRNGSGKSTLLKMMAGILKPTSGQIVRKGSICTLLDIGTGFHEDLSGRENVYVDGAILNLPEKYLNSLMPEIESFAELQGFMDTPLRYYSSGMRARLGFAVAMSADPDIFLIDEILAVGDEGFCRKCLARLDELISRGRTVVIVSHDMEAVKRFCSRGIWLHGGVVQADGPIDDVCEQYMGYFDTVEMTVSPGGGSQ